MKRIISSVLVIVLCLMTPVVALAADSDALGSIGLSSKEKIVLAEVSKMSIDLINQNGEVSGTVTIPVYDLTVAQRNFLLQYIEENGIQELERKFKQVITGEADYKSSQVNVVEYTRRKEVSSETQQVRANGNFSKTTTTYRLKTLVNPDYPNLTFECEWWAHVTVNFKKENDVITQVTGTGFNATDMTYPCAFEDVSILNYVGVDGTTCGATANYDVYKYFEIPLPMPIPIKFSVSTFDYVIAYSSDY